MLPRPHLDPRSELPLYRQLYEFLSGLIRSGALERGSRLPATRELAGSLGLNRATVSAAYGLLEAENLISGHVGRGSFVTGGPVPGHEGLDWDALLGSPPTGAPPAASISFATSRPAEDLFPLAEFRETCEEVLALADLASILQLGSPAGYEPLRRRLVETAAVRSGDDLLVTSGCQQALDLVARVLVRPGDRVVVEDPVYPGLKNVFARMGARLEGVPTGSEGIEIEPLERVLASERPRLVVVTSNFQNPTGGTLSVASRRAILRAARHAGAVVVESDIYGELRYLGEHQPALKELEGGEDVVLLRSFSKITFPGLRVGWLIAPRALVARLTEAKQLADLHTDQLAQAVLLRFLESGRLERHRARVLQAGAERLSAVLDGCARHLPAGAAWTRPQGGMNLWVELPAPLDAAELLERAAREGVSYLPGHFFAVKRPAPGGLRLSFAGLAPDRIEDGLARLGRIFTAELERLRTGRALEPAPAMV